jgi:hypothetical protein
MVESLAKEPININIKAPKNKQKSTRYHVAILSTQK